MKTKKRIFLLIAIIFFGAIIYISYDMSTKTTFPGAAPEIKEQLDDNGKQKIDTTDTLNNM